MNCKSQRIDVQSVFVPLIGITILCIGLLPLQSHAGEEVEFSTRALAATGKINVDWRSMGGFFPSEGIGFCIHPDGFIVTALEVVGDPAKAQRQQRSSSHLILLTYTPWGQDQRSFPAKVVAKDRRRNLALIKVDLEAVAYLEVSKSKDLAKGDPIWVVEDGRILQGDVGDKERGSRGREVGFATNLGLAEGAMGAPLLDRHGEVVGIRTVDTDGRRESRSIPTRWLSDFLSREAVDVTLDPAVITDLTQPMRIRLDPVMIVGTVGGGSIEILLEGQKKRAVFLEVEGGWETEITLPALEGGAPEEAIEAKVTIILNDGDGELLWRRRVKVDVLSLLTGKYQHRDGPALQERELDLGEKSSGGTANHVADSRVGLNSVAGSVSLKKNASGVAMIDDNAVQQAGDARPDPARYESLEDKMKRSLAERFDVLSLKIQRKSNTLRQMSVDPNTEKNDLYRLAREIDELRIRRGKLVAEVQEALICQCSSRLWFECAEAKCNISAFQSSLVDYANGADAILVAREEAKAGEMMQLRESAVVEAIIKAQAAAEEE